MKRKSQMPDESVEAEDGGEYGRPDGDDSRAVEKSFSVENEDNSGSEGPEKVDKKSRGGSRRILYVCLLLSCLLLAAVGLHVIKAKLSQSSMSVTIAVASATRIIRPVPQPDYKEMLDFLIIYQVQGRQMVTALRMEAVFHSLLKYKNFKKQGVVFRHAVYDFLLRQDAADNTERAWHVVFGKNLLEYLRIKLPESCPDRIRLTQIENL